MTELNTGLSSNAVLANLLQVDEKAEALWSDRDLQQLLRHQLDAPLPASLSDALPMDQQRLMALCAGVEPSITTLRALFEHPAPGGSLLVMVKEHAKLCRDKSESLLPESLALTLYYAAIAAALARHQVRITSLNDKTLIEGFNWVLAQPWMDATIKTVMAGGLDRMLGR